MSVSSFKIKQRSMVLICAVLSVVYAKVIYAQTDQSLFIQANTYYADEKYDKALEVYKKLKNENQIESADLCFNIGNCYFKLNQLGKAILYYERARMVRPRNRMVNHNLLFARRLVQVTIEDKRPWHIQKLDHWLGYISNEETILLLLFFAGLMFVFVICALIFPHVTLLKRLRLYVGIFLIITAVLMSVNNFIFTNKNKAVVIDDDVKALYGPIRTEKIAFRLVQGHVVRLVEKRGDWYKIELTNASSGWVQSSHVEAISSRLRFSETI